MIRLIVSEKPSMGRAIAAALGIQGSGRSFLQGEGLIVTWCVGHLVEAVGPEAYDPALKQWRLDTVPFFPERFRYAPIEATREQYDTVARLMNREDVGEVVKYGAIRGNSWTENTATYHHSQARAEVGDGGAGGAAQHGAHGPHGDAPALEGVAEGVLGDLHGVSG